MVTAKRLYIYGVMGAALVPLLWGLTELLRLTLRALGAAAGAREIVGADMVADEVSFAIALVLVAAPIWLVHVWLARRSLRGPEDVTADERSSSARSTYFFLVLLVTGAVACLQLYEVVQQLLGATLSGTRMWGMAGATASLLVFGVAWLGHLWWRRADLRAAPRQTADDWLTRAYLYGTLFILAVIGAVWFGSIGSIVVGEIVGARALWEYGQGWQEAIVSPVAGAVAASLAWTLQWLLAGRLLRAEPPMGAAHRASRTRTGYFLAVVLVSAAAVLALLSSSLQHVFAELFGVWRPMEGSRLIEDVGGPLVMAVPFVVTWLWHWRRAGTEARAFGGEPRHTAVLRSRRLVVAFVGLAGLAIGLAWEIYAVFEYMDLEGRSLVTSTALRENATPALAAVVIGLVMWAPAWARAQQERAREPVAVASATSRRAYLLLVSGIAVVACMASLAYLVYQATRAILDAGPIEDVTWAGAVVFVAGIVLAYHLVQLRADARITAAATAELAPEAATPRRMVETIEISAPPGADFKILNAAIRSELPPGYEMQIRASAPRA